MADSDVENAHQLRRSRSPSLAQSRPIRSSSRRRSASPAPSASGSLSSVASWVTRLCGTREIELGAFADDMDSPSDVPIYDSDEASVDQRAKRIHDLEGAVEKLRDALEVEAEASGGRRGAEMEELVKGLAVRLQELRKESKVLRMRAEALRRLVIERRMAIEKRQRLRAA